MKSRTDNKWNFATITVAVATFAVCVVLGYYAVSLLTDKANKYAPLIVTVIKGAYLESENEYGLELGSNWTGENSVRYDLFQPQDTLNAVYSNNDSGHFSGIKAIAGGVYYVRAYVDGKTLESKLLAVNGFDIIEPEVLINPLNGVECYVTDVRNVQDNMFSFGINADISDDIISDVEYVLYRSRNHDTIRTEYTSGDGRFNNVRTTRGEKYFMRLEVVLKDSLFVSDYFPVERVTWTEPRPQIEQLDIEEVQNLINEKRSLLNNSHFVRSASVIISNPNETSATWKTLDNFMQQKFAWSSVIVESLSFDKDNRIDKVYLSVNYNE